MNILLVYLKQKWTVAEYVEKALKKFANVYSFDFASTPYWGDFRFRLPFYIPKGWPVSVLKVIKKFNVDFDLIIEITSAGQYHLTGYKKLKKQNIKNVLWATDIYRFDQRKFILWIKDDFDYIFSSQKNFLEVFKPKSVYWLPYGCATEVHKKFDLPKIYDVVFVGNTNPKVYPERVRLLKLIGEKFNLKVFSGRYGEEMSKIYSQAKIVFNKSAGGEINMRVFETLATGSLLLTDRLKPEAGLEEIFQDKKHLVLYEDEIDLLEKIDYYLTHESEREEIALAGYKEVLAKHTYEQRVKEMLRIVKSVVSN